MQEDLWCITSVSIPKKGLTIQDLKDNAAIIRENRKTSGNTGLVVFSPGNVLITIEGSKQMVEEEFEISRRNPAHHSLIKLYSGPIPHRLIEDVVAFRILATQEFRVLDDFQDAERREYFEEFISMNYPVARLVRDFIKTNT